MTVVLVDGIGNGVLVERAHATPIITIRVWDETPDGRKLSRTRIFDKTDEMLNDHPVYRQRGMGAPAIRHVAMQLGET